VGKWSFFGLSIFAVFIATVLVSVFFFVFFFCFFFFFFFGVASFPGCWRVLGLVHFGVVFHGILLDYWV